MPFDQPLQHAPTRPRGDSAVAGWLFALCGMILVMVTLGGATRLSGSGLSIMEWAPLMGALPPLSEAEWNRLYTLYQQIPQYSLTNQGFGLAGFKGIFWLEWTHRLWGRMIGLAFILPLLWFGLRGRISRRLALRLAVLLAVGALQGVVGWLMVASGFDAERTSVSAYRLVAHLALAIALYAAILWTALGLWRPIRLPQAHAALRPLAAVLCGLIVLTMLAGGFVAGLKAGLTYNSFPFMDGRLVPVGYAVMRPWYLNFFENVATVQFNHRLLATITAALATGTVMFGVSRVAGTTRTCLLALGAAVIIQYCLGILTLIWAVPLPLAVAHQATAMLVLTAALALFHDQNVLPADRGAE